MGVVKARKIPQTLTTRTIPLSTANGLSAKGKLSKAEKVFNSASGGGECSPPLPIVVQKNEEKRGSRERRDGLIGMSFSVSRFEVQMTGGFIEVRTRRRKLKLFTA